ncbi:MAG: YraN family protein [Betaproteobacteria bacterium]
MGARGDAAENLAAAFLQRAGLTLVERNYRCRFGEIDLIAREGATLVFVEVRMRSSERFGGAAASITAAKRMKLLRTARFYLAGVARWPQCRFDALLISGKTNSIEWLKNAFAE